MKSSPPSPIDPDDPNNDVATSVKPFKPTPKPELRSGPANPPPMPMDKPFLSNTHDVIPQNGKELASSPAGLNNTPPELSRTKPMDIPKPNFMRPVRQMEDRYGIKVFIPLAENNSSDSQGELDASPSDNNYRTPESSLLSDFDLKNTPLDEKVNNFRGTPSRSNDERSPPPSPPPIPPPRAASVGGSFWPPPTHSNNFLNQSKNNNTKQLSPRNRFRETPLPFDTQVGGPVQPSRSGRESNSNSNASSSSDSDSNEESSAYNRRSGPYGRHTGC